MKKVLASVVALVVVASAAGCAGIPGMECKFSKGEVSASVQGDAKAFLTAAMDLKKESDSLEAQWQAEIKGLAGDLKVEPADETAVLAKLNANVAELKAKGQCNVTFDANLDASASGSAAGSGSASSTSGASSSGNAAGNAAANVDVKFDVKCAAEADVKGTLDVTVAAVRLHFPKLLGIVAQYKAILPKVKATADAGTKVMANVKSNLTALPEIKCAVEAVTGIKAQARVDFSIKASASAKGEAKAG